MTLSRGFDPHLAVGETTVTSRDVEMLRAIDDHGSMHTAADELGRSYPHLQRRVVELEDAIGDLTRRTRGGSGGGGTELTPAARDLIQQFERLRVELDGVTSVPESIVEGTVVAQDGELATVETAAGELTARVPPGSTDVEIAIRADAVVLMDPDSASADETSLRNRLPGTVMDVDLGNAVATVTLELGEDVTIQSIVTEESVETLGIDAGTDLLVAFKSTAARAIATDD